MRHVGRRTWAGLVLLGTLGLVAVLAGPGAGADAGSVPGHDHSAAPDPVTAVALLANVVVIGFLAVRSRRTPPGVRDAARPSGRWTYREEAPAPRARDRPGVAAATTDHRPTVPGSGP